jgi:hypothetical protein
MQPRSLKRCLALGLAACAIAPATASAGFDAPVAYGGASVAQSGGVVYGDTKSDIAPPAGNSVEAIMSLTAPDQVDRTSRPTATSPQWPTVPGGVTAVHHAKPTVPGPPTWPAHPRPVGVVHSATSAQPSDDGSLDTGVWIALGTAAFAVAGGIGVAGSKRLRTARQRQLA